MTTLLVDDEVGKIEDPREQIYIQWNIENYFSSVTQRADFSVTSPDFHFANTTWYVKIFPNGQRANGTVGWINLYLYTTSCSMENKNINFSLAIKKSDKSLVGFNCVCLSSEFDKGYGFFKVIDRNELFRKKNDFVPGGTLTIVCRAKFESSVKDVASQTNYCDGISTLSEDLGNLFLNEKISDVTIKVKSRIFKVHKLILQSRSSVLSAMFAHNMKENTTGTVDIDDCEPEIFHDFLLYLYSGKVKNLSSNNVVDLYFLADKYDLEDLRLISLNFMKDNLDLGNVCEVVVIADRLNKEELKKSASQIIKSNLKTLIPSSQWIAFMGENPVLAAELLMEVLPDSKS